MNTTPTSCADSIHQMNPLAIVCDPEICSTFSESPTFQEMCKTFGSGQPQYPVSMMQCKNPQTGVITEPLYDPTWGYSCPEGANGQVCYCCCACLSNGTPLAVPDGMKPIEQFKVGDAITVGTWQGQALSWNTGAVQFSSGSDAAQPSTMMFIACGAQKQVIAAMDHLFLLSTGKFKRADRVAPSHDRLMGADGVLLDIISVQSGKWNKGLHYIATDLRFSGSADGHLINTAGIVSGDFCLQINQEALQKVGLMDAPEQSPAHGSRAYAAAYPDLHVTRAMAVRSGAGQADVAVPEGYTAFGPAGAIAIPPGAAQFFTDAQDADIVANQQASFRELHSDAGFAVLYYLRDMFKGFYPDIDIVIDHANPHVNTYAYLTAGRKRLVVSGELARLNNVSPDGYKFILAQGIARLLDTTPTDRHGVTCLAAADFQASATILRRVFYLDAGDLARNALAEMTTVFGLISAGHAAGDPDDVANDPSVQCRLACIRTGFFAGALLPCACAEPASATQSPQPH